MAKAQPMVYGVVVFRTDGEHIKVIEDSNYDKCFEEWGNLHAQWTAAIKEQTPFLLTSPVVTAFSPSMIFEIKLIPMISQEMAANSHNPYNRAMNEQGLSRTFPGGGIDLLAKTREF